MVATLGAVVVRCVEGVGVGGCGRIVSCVVVSGGVVVCRGVRVGCGVGSCTVVVCGRWLRPVAIGGCGLQLFGGGCAVAAGGVGKCELFVCGVLQVGSVAACDRRRHTVAFRLRFVGGCCRLMLAARRRVCGVVCWLRQRRTAVVWPCV